MVVLAVASLALPTAIAYDPWAWLVWGREVVSGELDTTAGPSWKPLPVAVAALLSAFGDAAPTLWLLVTRTASLSLVVVVFRLARRFGGAVAGALAVALLLLTPDGEPRFLRTVLEGHSAPIGAALALWAIDRHLDGHHRSSLALGVGVALLRPESWPLLMLYAGWCWMRDRSTRPWVAVGLASIPLLWFGGEWLGSGGLLQGASTAQVISGDAWQRLANSLVTAGGMVIVPAWVGALVATAFAYRRKDRALLALAGAALVWSGIVVAMSALLGYAAISRFFLPAAALVCVLAGTGFAWSLAAARSRRLRVGLAAVAIAVAVPLAIPRSAGLAAVVAEVRERGRLEAGLPDLLAHAANGEILQRCQRITVDGAAIGNGPAAWELKPGIAWMLGVPLGAVGQPPERGPAVFLVPVGTAEDAAVRARPGWEGRLVARSDAWAAYAIDC